MLRFPFWKVALVLIVLLWGALMALPNVMNTSGLPGFVPRNAVNLGLDLRGGVYLMMEVRPEEVVANRLVVVERDVGTAFDRSSGKERIFNRTEIRGQSLEVKLTRPGADGRFPMAEALKRLNAINVAVPGGVGDKTYEITQVGADGIRINITQAGQLALVKDAMVKTETIVRRRVDPDGVAEIELTPSGENRLVLEAPGEPDPEKLKSRLNRDGRMTFHLVNDDPSSITAAQAGVVPPGFRLLSSREGETLLVRTTAEIVGSDIATADPSFDEYNRRAIAFRLNSAGAAKFFNTTRRNVQKRFAIVLDDVIMSAPVIQQAIAGGNVQITGSFTDEEAEELAAVIEAGEMPAKLQFLDQRVVGSTLGEDAIRSGTLAALVGIALVAGFMILAYGWMGVFAVISLLLNVMLIFSALSLLGGTLTLPGIAGIILTVGMAVDANVLVFERIREEQRAGRSPWTATQAGYERALITILDANITTLLAAIILFFMGAGPVRGFAATLTIGILTSVFTAFVVTRMLTVWWMTLTKPKKLNI
jgi:preprotein translocase subunit SecD